MLSRPVTLGPLAVDNVRSSAPGVLLAGDAAGFIDPMTGDGIRLALASAETAAAVAADVLAGRLDASGAYRVYATALRPRVGRKRAFNRVLRELVGAPRAVRLAARVAVVWPGAFGAVIRYAGDASAEAH